MQKPLNKPKHVFTQRSQIKPIILPLPMPKRHKCSHITLLHPTHNPPVSKFSLLPLFHLIKRHLLLTAKRPQHAHALPPTPLLPPINLHPHLKHLPTPPARHHHTADDIHQPDQQREEAAPFLGDRQGNRLDVELDKDAGDVVLRHLVRLRGDGVLVGFHGVRGVPDALCGVVGVAVYGFEEGEEGGVVGVDGGDDGEVVLELVEVVFGGGDGVVEGVDEGGVVGAEGELLDVVREVEACVCIVCVSDLGCLV